MSAPISTQVLAICIAYEAGFGQGVCGREVENPYALRDAFEAWAYGYEQGAHRRKIDQTVGSQSLLQRLTGGAEACHAAVNRNRGEIARMFSLLESTLGEAAREIERLSRCACGLSTPHAYQLGRCTPGWKI